MNAAVFSPHEVFIYIFYILYSSCNAYRNSLFETFLFTRFIFCFYCFEIEYLYVLNDSRSSSLVTRKIRKIVHKFYLRRYSFFW